MEGQSSSLAANAQAGENVVVPEVILEAHATTAGSDTLEMPEPSHEQSKPPFSARGVTEDLRSELISDIAVETATEAQGFHPSTGPLDEVHMPDIFEEEALDYEGSA